jgi:hypothetical protein
MISALSLDADGNSYVAGTCYGQGQIAFPGATASCADASTQGFVAKYGPDGTAQWGRFFPSIDTVVVTADGTIAATATIDRTQMFGSVAIAATSTFTPVALRLSPTGDLLWAKPYGDPGLEYLHGPAIVNARGDLLSATTIGRAPSTQLPQISALDESGAMIWRAREQAGAARIGGLAGLADGTTVSAGTIAGYVADFGGGTIAGTMFVAAYADDGSFRDARAYGMASGNGGDEIAAIATSTSGAIAFVANVIDAVDFGTGPVAVHAGASNQDIVIGMIAPPH